MSTARTIIHLDVDAFFASIEQLLIPAMRNRPVIVGSGVIASCSYEARKFGLRAGMPLHQARKLCPQAVILEGHYQIYRCFAEHIWQICSRHTCGLETFLDEAYGDLTASPELRRFDPPALGRLIQKEIADEVGLPVSVGLAANRMMAKIASSSAKPAGVAWIAPGDEDKFLAPMPVRKLHGVGHATEKILRDMNITTIGELRELPRALLRDMLGRRGDLLYERCRGGDPQPAAAIRPVPPKSISRETTFHQSECDAGQIRGMLFYLLERAMRTARKAELLSGCVELSICYDDWKRLAARQTLDEPTDDDEAVFAVVLAMLARLHRRRVSLRHVGIVLSGFSPRGPAKLFEPPRQVRQRSLHGAIDTIRDRFGHAAVVTGESVQLLGKLEQNDYGFVLRTPSLTK